jgi:hypothetical protein
MPSAEVLDERVSGHNHPGATVLLEPTHRSQSCLQPAVIALDPVVGVPVGAVPRPGSSASNTAGYAGARSVVTSIGVTAVFRRHIHDGLLQGNPQARKALLRTLVAEIVVESRNTIRPFFKVPTLTSAVGFQRAVREVEGVVAHTVSYSNPQELRVRITRLAEAAGWGPEWMRPPSTSRHLTA